MRRLTSITAALGLSLLLVAGAPSPQSASTSIPEPIEGSGTQWGWLRQAQPAGKTAPLASEGVENFEFNRWEVDMELGLEEIAEGRDRAYADVTETIVPEFPDTDQNRGIVRVVPLELGDGTVSVSDIDVRDETGAEIEFDDDTSDGELTLELGGDDFVHGEQTYVVTYTLHDVIADLDNPEVQEFYATLLPSDRQQPLHEFAATITVLPDLAAEATGPASCYRGTLESTTQCDLDQTAAPDGSIEYRYAADDLDRNETVTVNLAFEPGTVVKPTTLDKAGWLGVAVALLGPLGALIAIALVIAQTARSRHARDGVVVAQYEPTVSPHVTGELIAATKPYTFTAGLLEVAVSRDARLEEATDGTEISLQRTHTTETQDALAPDASLEPVDLRRRFATDVLFPHGEESVTITGNTSLGERHATFAEQVGDDVVATGLIEKSGRAERARNLTMIAAGGAWVLSMVGLIVGAATGAGILAILGIVSLAIASAVFIWSASLPVRLRTEHGSAARVHLLGLRDYMKLGEADRISMLQSYDTADRTAHPQDEHRRIIDVYERLLPYAVLFRLDKRWAAELETHYAAAETTPYWASNAHPGLVAVWLTSLSTASSSTQPQTSSGTSGYSGAGMAGGGFGGGSVGGR